MAFIALVSAMVGSEARRGSPDFFGACWNAVPARITFPARFHRCRAVGSDDPCSLSASDGSRMVTLGADFWNLIAPRTALPARPQSFFGCLAPARSAVCAAASMAPRIPSPAPSPDAPSWKSIASGLIDDSAEALELAPPPMLSDCGPARVPPIASPRELRGVSTSFDAPVRAVPTGDDW